MMDKAIVFPVISVIGAKPVIFSPFCDLYMSVVVLLFSLKAMQSIRFLYAGASIHPASQRIAGCLAVTSASLKFPLLYVLRIPLLENSFLF